jgi:DNA processing protein
VQSAADVIELLTGFDGKPRSVLQEAPADWSSATEDTAEPADIGAMLTTAPVSVDELVRQSGSTAGAIQLALLELELAGCLVRHAGGRVSLTG